MKNEAEIKRELELYHQTGDFAHYKKAVELLDEDGDGDLREFVEEKAKQIRGENE